ncbi:MAG: hypothetical protein ACOYLK_10695 [Sphingomonas sp.]
MRTPSPRKPRDAQCRLLDVLSGPYRLGDGVRGYATSTGGCIDLAAVLMALGIPIRLDKKLRRATGWAFDERRTVTIDRASDLEQLLNNQTKVASDDIRNTQEGWRVATTALLSVSFPVRCPTPWSSPCFGARW